MRWVNARCAHHETSSRNTTASRSVVPIGGAALPVWWFSGTPSSAHTWNSGS
jgi:hypothetical protein